MTVVSPTGEINIAAVVDRYEAGIAARARGLRPGLAILSDERYRPTATNAELGPVERYIRALETTASRVGVSTRVEASLAHAAIAGTLDAANADPSVHGIVLTLPLAIEDEAERARRTAELLGDIDPAKDVDGLRPGGMPATSEAAAMLLQAVTEDRGLRVHVRGGNGHVGGGLVRLLKSQGYKVTGSDINTSPEEKRELLDDADALISATGVAEGLGPDDFDFSSHRENSAKKILINIGRGINKDGKTVGDFSPELLKEAASRGWPHTNSGLGVGRLATLTVMSRDVASAKASPTPSVLM